MKKLKPSGLRAIEQIKQDDYTTPQVIEKLNEIIKAVNYLNSYHPGHVKLLDKWHAIANRQGSGGE